MLQTFQNKRWFKGRKRIALGSKRENKPIWRDWVKAKMNVVRGWEMERQRQKGDKREKL